MTLGKASPQGIVVWWQRAVAGAPCIDVSTLAHRARDAASRSAMQQAWDTAHEMFRQRVREHAPIEVDVEGQ